MNAAASAETLPPRAQALVQHLGMQPHPEGGWYVEVYRSTRAVQPQGGAAGAHRSALTAIYFLLGEGQISRWHMVSADEVWCHLEGDSVALYRFDAVDLCTLGPVTLAATPDGAPLQQPQATVPAGVWQAAHSLGAFSLVACFVAPGFEFADFRLMRAQEADHQRLQRLAPDWAPWVLSANAPAG
jgi:uncharacterized protein